MKYFLLWLFGVIIGVILWWGLTFIPAINNFNNNSHEALSNMTQERSENSEPETTAQVQRINIIRALNLT